MVDSHERPVLDVRIDGFEREFDGLVLVADMAGYTRFADQLTASGSTGVERLGQVVERSIARYLDVIAAHGGCLSSLAGDAVIVHWPLNIGQERDTTERAVACAQTLVTSPPGELPMHAGLAAGLVWAGSCPGFDRDTDSVFGGVATRTAFRAAKQALAGEVLVNGRVHELCGLPRLRDTAQLARLPTLAPAARERGDPGTRRDAWSAELRTVAALFSRLLSFDETQRGSWGRHREALLLIQEELGTSAASGRLVIDDSGLVVVSVFGEPEGARSDPPDVIVERAARLISALEQRGFPMAAGLGFGRAFCGRVGASADATLVCVGRSMNVAARLMERAERGLLVAEMPTARRHGWLVPHGALALRGLLEPVKTLRCVADDRIPATGRPLFGREGELARLTALLFALREGTASICIVRADAGMGKTTLLAAVEARAVALGIATAHGRAHAVQRAAPYFLWRQVLRSIIQRSQPEASIELVSSFTAQLQRLDQPLALAPLFNAVFPFGFAETTESQALVGKNRAEATLELLLTLIKDSARAPLLIVLDDVHLGDSASLALLERVAQNIPNVLLVIAARPSAITSDIIYRLHGLRCHQIDLRALEHDAIEAMTRNRLDDEAVEPSVVDLISRASEGNPLFVHEYVLLLRELGRIAHIDRRWTLARTDIPALPATVLAAISSRIHVLPAREQHTLKIASVLGDSFSRDLLLRAGATSQATELDATLANLERSGLIVQHSLHEDRLGFSHAAVREAAYDLMLSVQRGEVHSSIAHMLEERREFDTRTSLPLLVHHYAAAGDDARTIKFAELAASEAMRQGAYREAAELLRLCLAAAERTAPVAQYPDRRIRWHRELSEAMGGMGDLKERRKSAQRAVQLAGLPVRRSQLLANCQTLFSLMLRVLTPAPKIHRLMMPSPRSALHHEMARAFYQLSFAAYFAGERHWFAHYVLRCVAHAQRARQIPELVFSLAQTGACMGYLGFHRAGRRYIRTAIELGTTLDCADSSLEDAHMVSSLYLVGCGDWGEARQHVDHCQASARASGNNHAWGNAQAIRFWMYCYQGSHAEALLAAEQLLQAADRSGNKQHLCWAHRFLGLMHRRAGHLDEALTHLRSAHALLDTQADLNEVVQVAGVLAGVLLEHGEHAPADELASKMIDRLQTAPGHTGHALLEGCSGLAEVAVTSLARQRWDTVRRARAHVAIRVLQRYSRAFAIGRPRYYTWHAELLWCLGRKQAAQRARRNAQYWAAHLGMAHELTQLTRPLGFSTPTGTTF